MKMVISATLIAAALAFVPFRADAAVAKKTMDNLALGNIARACGLRINSEASAFLAGQRQAAASKTINDAKEFATWQLKTWTGQHGRKEACRRFRGMLSDMGWL
ncbi:hypothetical protein ACWGTI_03490 [Mesorhizobium sp. ArgA1]